MWPEYPRDQDRERSRSAAAALAELNVSETQHGPRSVCSDWFGGGYATPNRILRGGAIGNSIPPLAPRTTNLHDGYRARGSTFRSPANADAFQRTLIIRRLHFVLNLLAHIPESAFGEPENCSENSARHHEDCYYQYLS